MHPVVAALIARGWIIRECDPSTPLLPEPLQRRYPRVPPALVQFLASLDECRNRTDDVWMLTPREYRIADDTGFRWNEFELMALDFAAGNADQSSRIRDFWDAHLPFMLAVHSDYDYLAVRVADPGFGTVVHGMAPEWTETSDVDPSFESFLTRFTREAASPTPAYPYSVFLTEGDAISSPDR